MATYSSIVTGKISWTEAPGRLHSLGLKRVTHTHTHNTYGYVYVYMLVCLCIYSTYMYMNVCMLAIYVLYM